MAAPLNFRSNLVLYAMCAAAAYFAFPWIQRHFGPDMTPYTEAGPYRGDSTGARNHTGVEPYGGDGRGGGRGYSDYFPGNREGRPAREARRPYQLHLDPDATDDVEDRRGDLSRLGPSWDQARGDDAGRALACWDHVERHRVDPSYCERGRR
jgi:hypothetical protein